jgi:hypothetical protein
MVTDTLVEQLINDGQKLVERLPQNGFEVTTVLWLKSTYNGRWYFYIISPVVENEGILQAYGRLHPLIRQMPQPFWIDPLEVKLIGPSDPLAKDVLAIHRHAPAPLVYPRPWGGIRLGSVSIEGAYLYPLAAGVTV